MPNNYESLAKLFRSWGKVLLLLMLSIEGLPYKLMSLPMLKIQFTFAFLLKLSF